MTAADEAAGLAAFCDAWQAGHGGETVIAGGNADVPYLFLADLRALLDELLSVSDRCEVWRNLAKKRGDERDQLAARVNELEGTMSPLDPAAKTCRRCGHWFLSHRSDTGCAFCACNAGRAEADAAAIDGDAVTHRTERT